MTLKIKFNKLRNLLDQYNFFIYHLCYILGTFFLNIFSLLFILLNTNYFSKKNINSLNKNYIFLIIFSSIYLLINSFLSTHPDISFFRFLSILKFFVFVYCLYSFFNDGDFEHKFFVFSKWTCFVVLFASVDLIIQYHFGKNLFFASSPDQSGLRFSRIFFDELIIGSFLSYFFLFGSFYMEKKNYFALIPYFLITIYAIVISGEKKALIMSIFVFLIYFICKIQNLKKIILFIVTFSLIISSFFILNKKTFQRYFDSGGSLIRELGFNSKNEQNYGGFLETPHVKHFRSALIVWENNKFIGSGLKTFRLNCSNKKNVETLKDFYCSTHPHNLYFEILSELGLIGLFLLLTFIYLCLSNFLQHLFNLNKNFDIYILVSLGMVLVFFPFQPTGSFFSSKNIYLNSIIFALFLANIKYLNIKKLNLKK